MPRNPRQSCYWHYPCPCLNGPQPVGELQPKHGSLPSVNILVGEANKSSNLINNIRIYSTIRGHRLLIMSSFLKKSKKRTHQSYIIKSNLHIFYTLIINLIHGVLG